MKGYMKPSPQAKLHRNYLIREFKLYHPEFSLEKIAAVFSITKQRVWAIIKAGNEHGEAQNPTPGI